MDNSGMVEYCAFNDNSLNEHLFSVPINDIDIGRESIPILELNASFGRESLGILKLGCDVDPSDHNFSLNNVPELSATNVLNQAFILSSRRASDFKSVSTYSMKSSNISFNIRELEQFSAIGNLDYSNSILLKDSFNKFNDGFLYSTKLNGPSLFPYRSQIRSLPAYMDREHEICKEQLIEQMMNRVSEGCQKLNDSILNNKSSDEDNMFNDSVFIEARHLSTKFSEGSNDDFMLDDTDPPALISGDLDESKCDNKCNTEEVFKKIDKMLPVDDLQKLNAKLNSRSSNILKQISNESKKDNKENYAIDSLELKSSPLEATSDVEQSREILHTLSQILSKDDRSEKETEQGQNLLHTLSDILNNKSRERSKSFTNNSFKISYGTEEMQASSTKSEDNSLRSNDSSSAKHNLGNSVLKRHSNSFSYPTKALRLKHVTSFGKSPSSDLSNNKSSANNSSERNKDVKNFSVETSSANLKIKKRNCAPSRPGPMKATLSIDNLIKSKPKETPPKVLQNLPKRNSKISTPIRDVQIQPMAQSTPDNKIDNCSSSSVDPPNVRSFSSSNLQEKSVASGYSTSLSSYKDSSISKDNSSLQKSHLPRRNSISDDRKSSIPSYVRRSNSMKETTLMKTMNKIRMNISGSGALRDCSNIPAKDGSLYGKVLNSSKRIMKSFGKENSSGVQ